MDAIWILIFLAAILNTVAGAPESVFALVGNSVTLIMKGHDNLDPDDVLWVFNQSHDIVRYYPYHAKSRHPRVTAPYRGRVEFDNSTFSLELKNLQKSDSGLYKGEMNLEGGKDVVEYNLSILEHVSTPVLKVQPDCFSGGSCNVTCKADDLSVTFTCNHSTCAKEDESQYGHLTILMQNGSITCNHSNPVSWSHDTMKIETLTQRLESLIGEKWSPIWITVGGLGLVLLVFFGALCHRMHSKPQADSSSNVCQSAGTLSPPTDVKRPSMSESTCSYAEVELSQKAVTLTQAETPSPIYYKIQLHTDSNADLESPEPEHIYSAVS